MRQVSKALILPLLCLCRGELLVILEPHNNHALQCQLQLWKMLETSLCLLFSAAQPQKDVPWAHLQEDHRRPGQQAKQWHRQQWPWGFFQGHPQKGQQSGRCQLPGLERHLGLPAFTTLQWMGDLTPSQVPQEGFR